MHRRASPPWLHATITWLWATAALVGCHGADPLAAPPGGSLSVSNATTGGAFDLDGFEVRIDGGDAALMEVNDSLPTLSLAEGLHAVRLNGLADNCETSTDPEQEVAVTDGAAIRLEFTVTCTPPTELASLRIVFARAIGNTSTLVAMNADGSDAVALTSGAYRYGPDVSPDGSRILFLRDRFARSSGPSLNLMNANGTGETELPWGPAYEARWSPDGREIAFTGLTFDGAPALYVMPADGSQPTPLTGQDPFHADSWPAWSPDGTKIAFTRERPGDR